MIYYASNLAEFMHKTLFCLASGYELISEIMNFEDSYRAQRLLEKWNERYDLLLTPQQQHRKFLSGDSTFCCVIFRTLNKNPEFQPSDEAWANFEVAPHHPEFQMMTQRFGVVLFCRPNPMLLVKNGERIAATDRLQLDFINQQLRSAIKGCDKFEIPGISVAGYRLIRRTKRAKSLKELEMMSLSENSKHATDWTWELTKDKYNQVREVGMNLIQRFHENCNNPEKPKMPKEKRAYWERHFRSLEGFIGFRGVRSQIGKLWNEENTLFRKKYNYAWLDDHYGCARKLKLTYIKAPKMKIENNMPIDQAFSAYKTSHIDTLKILHEDWKKSKN